MRFDLSSGTDAGLHLLYDPAAVMHRLTEPYGKWHARILDDCRDANLIAYSNGGDGEARFRVYVDEAPDPDVSSRAFATSTGHLRVPSGRLFASGMEHLDSRGRPPADAAEFAARNAELASCEIPSGAYDVEAYDVDPESEKVQAAQQQAFDDARREHPLGHRLWVAHHLVGLFGLLHFATIVFLVILALFFFADRYAAKLLVFESGWGLVYRALAVAWAVRIALGLLPPLRRFRRAFDTVAEGFPLTVVVLRRRAGDPALWAGVSFGEIDLPPVARPSYELP